MPQVSADPVAALRDRAESLLQADRPAQAISAYRDLLAASPRFADGWFNLAFLLQTSGQFAEAVACYGRAIEFGVERPEDAWRNQALILTEQLARHDEAEQALRAALKCNERFVPAWIDLGRIAEQGGRRDEARAAYDSALAIEPSHALALSHLANVTRARSADDPLLLRLRAAIGQRQRPPADKATLGFALGKALDEAGAYDEAFGAYSAANRASRASAGPGWRGYDRAAWEAWTRRLPTWFNSRHTAPEQTASEGEPQLVFVCGMFRSGSTLVETILASHPQITAGGELDQIPRIGRELWARVSAGQPAEDPEQLALARQHYLRAVAERHPQARVFTDKRPDNFLHVGLIRRLFPAAKIVHTRRDALDTCLSVFFTHFDPSQTYATDLADIAHWYRLYESLMADWKAQFGDEILDVDYEALVADPQPQIERLLEFIGLEWDDACLAFHQARRAVQTPSVWQVRKPLYASSCGRWRHYRAHLGPLAAALGRRLE
jgi:tetratricopeptide (TPR) repeat protein